MNVDPRSPRALWRRALLASCCALAVVVVLACGSEELLSDAAHGPRGPLLFLVSLVGLPCVLRGVWLWCPGRSAKRTIGRALRDPITWSGAVGVTVYLTVVAAGFTLVGSVPGLCRSFGSVPFGGGQFYMTVRGTAFRCSEASFHQRFSGEAGSLEIDLDSLTAVDGSSGMDREPMSLAEAVEAFAGRAGLSDDAARRMASEVVDVVCDLRTRRGFTRMLASGAVLSEPVEEVVFVLAIPVCFLGLVVFFYVIESGRASLAQQRSSDSV